MWRSAQNDLEISAIKLSPGFFKKWLESKVVICEHILDLISLFNIPQSSKKRW